MKIENEDTAVNVFWFRRDLRLHDNHGLYQALNAGLPVLPVFIFDTDILNALDDRFDRRVDFIHQAINSLNKDLQKAGSRILTFLGKPQEIFLKLIKQYTIQAVYTNHDYESYAVGRDEAVRKLLREQRVGFHSFKDQVIFEKNEVLKKDGRPYTVYTPYSNAWRRLLSESGYAPYPSEKWLDRLFRDAFQDILSLEEIGFRQTDVKFTMPGFDENLISNYHKTRNYPAIAGTTRLGIHLRFGTVSVRECVRKGLELNDTWLNELIWREFFMMILYHFPYVENGPFRKQYERIKWENDPEKFDRWRKGETGYPLVDAGMRELNATGFMHNRVRMVTAGFLVKHLLIDWRWGERYFARKLLDYELSSNNGNWQWAAGCGCDAAPYFRIFNPESQQKKFDPGFIYIKKWLPEFGSHSYPKPIVDHKPAREKALRKFGIVKN
ncbi:MAG: deoxyribodipyrimidine photo-lyase [Calditrichaceae bacterium]|nr:deoxyribodipyrimidine photo-lyase [Calditrichaceae bacterium]RQV92963.1 MAG: deoxyribodipyrimidine photo-lyase [Calditrichota bacterium]